MAKAIVIAVSDGFGGYGDFLFALKLSEALKKQYRDAGVDAPPIYLVTQPSGREKILKLKGDTEFGVEVLTPNTLKERVESTDPALKIEVDTVIEAPIFSSRLIDQIEKALASTPVAASLIMIAEYGVTDCMSAFKEYETYRKRERASLRLQHKKTIYSGLHTEEAGVLVTEALSTPSAPTAAASQLDNKIRSALFGSTDIPDSASITHYQETTELSMQYSHDLYATTTTRTAAQRFLDIHRAFASPSPKNQDILMIGQSLESKYNALKSILPLLISNGFTRISFYNADTGSEEILHDAGESAAPKKNYRVIYTASLSHPSMLAATTLSGPLTGATGDQSFSEAISADKIMLYECLCHKTQLIRDYDAAILKELLKDEHVSSETRTKIQDMIVLLRKETLSITECNHLGELIRDPTVQAKWVELNKAVIREHTLSATIYTTLTLSDVASRNITEALREKIREIRDDDASTLEENSGPKAP